MEQNQIPLLEAVTDFIATKPAYFRIPGHRLGRGISPHWTDSVGTKLFAYDVTETPLTDDLHSPEGRLIRRRNCSLHSMAQIKVFSRKWEHLRK